MDNYFDKIYIINLDDRKLRKKFMILEMKKYNITNYEIFNAVKPNENPFNWEIPTKHNHLRLDTKIKQNSCKSSHYSVIRKAHDNGYKKILVLEDDIHFIEDPNKFIKDLPQEWHLLHLFLRYYKTGNKIKNNIHELEYTTGCQAIGYNFNDPKLADYLFPLFESKLGQSYPIDDLYVHKVQRLFRCICLKPSIIVTDLFDSCINEISILKQHLNKTIKHVKRRTIRGNDSYLFDFENNISTPLYDYKVKSFNTDGKAKFTKSRLSKSSRSIFIKLDSSDYFDIIILTGNKINNKRFKKNNNLINVFELVNGTIEEAKLIAIKSCSEKCLIFNTNNYTLGYRNSDQEFYTLDDLITRFESISDYKYLLLYSKYHKVKCRRNEYIHELESHLQTDAPIIINGKSCKFEKTLWIPNIIFKKENKKKEIKLEKKLKVKIITDYSDPNEFKHMFDHTTANLNLELVSGNEKADYNIIINVTKRYHNPSKSIICQMEPSKYFKNIEYPKNYLHIYSKNELIPIQYYSRNINITKPKMDKVCCLLSEKYFDPGHIDRVNFCKSNKFMEIYGKQNYHDLNNYFGVVPEDKPENVYSKYKYVFNVENHTENNYTTEKLWDAIMNECLCFYQGNENLENYIDPRAFVRIDCKNEDTPEIILNAIRNDLWLERIGYILEAKKKILNNLGFFVRINNILTEHHIRDSES